MQIANFELQPRLLEFISFLSYATPVWSSNDSDIAQNHQSGGSRWFEDFSKLVGPVNATEEGLTSVLCQLSAAISTGRSLPPGMKLPKAYHLSEKLIQLDPDILRANHMQEVGYSAYAVMELISNMITHNVDTLATQIESLVGVIDFSNLDTDYKRKNR